MKKLALYVSAIVAAGAIMTGSSAVVCKSANPICQTAFTPDPAPLVYDDTLSVYTGRYRDGNNDFYYMTGYQVLSTTDMQNWTNHGCIMEDTDFSWGKKDSAWASQCIERNGKFYFYMTFENASGGGRAIGVAVADSPTGPFKDAIGKPLVGPNWDYIDPTVMIDDDGQAWLMFGNPTCYYVKLNEDMISTNGPIQHFDMNASSFGPSSKASSYGEGPWIYKHDDLYYLVYAAFYGSDGGESMGYSTAPSITGPWTYGGQIMKPHNCFTTHGGIIDYKDRSYFFYHKNGLPGGGTFNRSAAVEEFKYGANGSIPLLTMSDDGPKQIETLNPYKRTEAETICWSEGVKVESCSQGGTNISNIKNGAYVKVKGVDFQEGAETFKASVASAGSGGKIEIHLDSKTGPIVGVCNVSVTDGWQSWEETSCNISGADGEHDVYFVFTGSGSDYLFNVDWWQFGSDKVSAPGGETTDNNGYIFKNTFENGTESWSGRGAASVSSVSGQSYAGSKALFVSDREAAWNGATKKLSSSTFVAGKEYSFSAAVKYTDGPATAGFRMTLQYDLDDETYYEHIDEQTAVKGEYLHLYNPSYKIPAGAANLYLIIETVDEDTISFYADEIIAAQGGTEIEGPNSARLIRGDINCDGVINVADLCLIKAGVLGTDFDGAVAKLAADVDQSETVDATDALLLRKYLLGSIDEFPVNKPVPVEPPKPSFNYNSQLSFKEAPGNYFNQCSQKGKIIKETYNGINGSNTLNVYLPYGYDSNKQYNIFYLMHGGGENENTIFSDDVKLGQMLDNMIMNGELEPMIVVTPTFNKCTAQTFYKEWRASVIPFVEGKYSTYAKSTSAADIAASRMHRAYGGFSMGSASTWAGLINSLDICAYWMPLSGDNWEASGSGYNKAKSVADAIDRSGLSKDQYFILAATGSEDIAYPNMNPQMEEMKKMSQFVYTSDFSKGNFYYLVAQGKTHWWGFVKHYIYDALPYFFHE